MKRDFTLEYWMDDGWFVGRLREVPGVFSQGETLDELESNVIDAYRMVISDQEEGYAPSSEILQKEVIVTM